MKNKHNISLDLEQLGNQFIGREKELKRVKEGFTLRGMRVIILHGIGGIGKTVTASKIAETLESNFDGIYAFDCSGGLKAENILMQLNEFLKRNGADTFDTIWNAEMPIEKKVHYMGQTLSKIKFLLIFDNFEDLLLEDKNNSEMADLELKKALKMLVNECRDSTRFLFTSRYTFNLTDGRLTNMIDEINLGELSRPEAIMVMDGFPDIARENSHTKVAIYEKTGGHPYTINIFGKHTNQKPVQDVLMDIASVNKEMVESTLLDKAYECLSNTANTLIKQISVFLKPIPLEAVEWMKKDNGQNQDVGSEIEELLHWGLIIKADSESGHTLYQTHTLVKDFIKTKTEGPERKEWLIKAAGFYEDLVKKTKDLWDHLDARGLYFEAEQYDKAGDIVSEATEYLYRWGSIGLVKKLNEQTIDTASDLVKAQAFHNLGIIYHDQGEYDKAIEKYNQSLKISEESGDKSAITSTIHQLGTIHCAQGKYDKAIEKYNQSLKISEELGDKSVIARTIHQLGTIHYVQEEYGKAIEKYNQSLKISEELGDKSVIASTIHQLGMVHHEQGEHDKAIEECNRSLKISEELENKNGIANTLGLLGKICGAKEDHKGAIRNYAIAFSIFESLNSPNKDFAANGLKQTKDKIGEEAFKRYVSEIEKESKGNG